MFKSNLISEEIKDAVNQMVQSRDNFIEEILNKWGFSREYVISHPDEFRMTYDGKKQEYYHNDTLLFRIVSTSDANSIVETFEVPYFIV